VTWLVLLVLLCSIGGCNVIVGTNNTITEKGIEADTKIKKGPDKPAQDKSHLIGH
jgi:hypothetical protein